MTGELVELARPTDDELREAVSRLQEMYSRQTLQLTDYLLRFGRHVEDCDPNSTTLRQCACGWLQAIATVWPSGKPEGQQPGETGDEWIIRHRPVFS